MSIHAFTSESYSENDRTEAWQDVLGGFGLRSAPLSAKYGEHATALSRASLDGVGLMRFAAGPQVFSPLPRRADLPILLIPAEDGAVLKAGGSPQTIPAGRIILLPRQNDWRVTFHRDMRAIVLSVTAESFGGRKINLPECRDPIVVSAGGLADVLAHTLEAAAEALETLSPEAWNTIRLSLAEMLLTLSRQKSSNATEPAGVGTQAALLQRLYDAIERKLGDPDINPARIAQVEGISERYLQKTVRGDRRQFHALFARKEAAALLGRSGQRDAGAPLGVRYRVQLRLQRCGAFQPLVSRPFRTVAAGVPATAGRTAVGRGRQSRTARLAAGCDRAIAPASPGARDRVRRTRAGSNWPHVKKTSRRIII